MQYKWINTIAIMLPDYTIIKFHRNFDQQNIYSIYDSVTILINKETYHHILLLLNKNIIMII